ncbi:MAG: hypothetical protein MUF00_14565, partial [Gemmatimonadaceae bacterium]|nr:hypothetical protein [Gemmatimonadaceae bacterium]
MLADGPYVSHHEDAHEEASVDERLSRVAARELLHQYGVCPLDVAGDGRLRVMVAAADAWPVAQEMAFAIGTNAHVIEADQSTIAAAIERRTYHRQLPRESAADADHDRSLDDARDMAEQPPIVRFVGRLLRDAISDHASDIHLDSSR